MFFSVLLISSQKTVTSAQPPLTMITIDLAPLQPPSLSQFPCFANENHAPKREPSEQLSKHVSKSPHHHHHTKRKFIPNKYCNACSRAAVNKTIQNVVVEQDDPKNALCSTCFTLSQVKTLLCQALHANHMTPRVLKQRHVQFCV